MNRISRRRFLEDVSYGTLVASLGASLVSDLGIRSVLADEPSGRLTFGDLEPLVAMIQETPIDEFLPKVVAEIKKGTPANKLVAATALANARTLGGTDYVGYHSLMALLPAYEMAAKLPSDKKMLPILKVLYRNAAQIQQSSSGKDLLQPIDVIASEVDTSDGQELRDLIRQQKMKDSEVCFANMVARDRTKAFNDLQLAIQDDINVHRVVLVWRAWSLLPMTGTANAHTMLRQSVRFCVDSEEERVSRGRPEPAVRQALVKLIDQYGLLDLTPGRRSADDAWVNDLATTVHMGTREEGAEAVAVALKEGFSPEVVAEAISLAANRLVLCDPGRSEQHASPDKPAGSVHGASVGVHASDAANAWRNIARVGNPRTSITSLVVGAFHTAGQQNESTIRYPNEADVESISLQNPDELLRETESAIRNSDQRRVCAVVQKYGDLGLSPDAMFNLLRTYATTEDGALHAEKYFQTTSEEFATLRPSLRWGQLVGLARVSASQYGFPAPGLEEAQALLT